MEAIFEKYIQAISSKFTHPETSEMGYRTDFEILLKGIFKSINVGRIDHDAKAIKGNKPDFVVLNHDVPILYIEAKDIGVSLDKVEKSEQMARYYGYANLVLTDYVEFRFYRNGLRYEDPISIAKYNLKNRKIESILKNYEHVAKTLIDFTQSHKEPIKSGKHLSKIMGGKAQRIRDNIRQFLSFDSEKNTDIMRIYETIKKLLIHDLTVESFADMYAQTLVYGLFVARYHDDTPDTFTRQEARDLIPASNPFLGDFFEHIAGRSFDKRLSYIVDELCEVFSHADVKDLMRQYFKKDLWEEEHAGPDPVIHFYEDFLKEYDPQQRINLGVFYTPPAVVSFIVRSVDEILKKDFDLEKGLADTSKIKVKKSIQGFDQRTKDGKKYKENEVHRVQVLDPAVGTGSFLNEVIKNIHKKFENQQGRWNAYVSDDLLPRIHGFELMMASYTIAHLKLGMTLKETGYNDFSRRIGIYLTNSLEEGQKISADLFSGIGLMETITEEAHEAGKIKKDYPIMVILGNPPYSGESSNNFEYANSLVNKYKFEPGGIEKLKERNPKWINDDYVKFIAFSEGLIEKNGEGVLGFITNHSYLDNPTFRGMRWKLAQTFDKIYIIDLHGNAKKKEKHPDGSKDENVFAIQQGVAIMIGVKKKKNGNKKEASVFVTDIFGKRKDKFNVLNEEKINYKQINLDKKQYYFVDKNIEGKEEYDEGFFVSDLFKISNVGIVTSADGILIAQSKEELLKQLYKAKEENSTRKTIQKLKKEIIDENKIRPISYRPFDDQYIYYETKVIERDRYEVMQNFLNKQNIGICLCRQQKTGFDFAHCFITNNIIESSLVSNRTSEITSIFPLYIYYNDGKEPNFNEEILERIEKIVGKNEPENILDYIYAALHSPKYREKYKEFLKTDFPRVPYPKNKDIFLKLVEKGKELRALHLLESSKLNNFITSYSIEGTDIVEKTKFEKGKVFINETQYLGNVPEIAWNFYIGGYQPAQKWLKDRKGRTLTNQDLEHYQKIIIALVETDKIMKEIDKIYK